MNDNKKLIEEARALEGSYGDNETDAIDVANRLADALEASRMMGATSFDSIESAAQIIYGTVPASVIVPWHELDTNRRVEFEDAARAIRHVFEKAHTPTDDEREALIVEWANVHEGPNAHAVLLEMLPIGDQMSLALRDALRELAAMKERA